MLRFELLHSDRLWLVDVQVTDAQINAGWVYTDGNLNQVEAVSNGQQSFDIKIDEQTQAITHPTEFYLSDDVIEFLRC